MGLNGFKWQVRGRLDSRLRGNDRSSSAYPSLLFISPLRTSSTPLSMIYPPVPLATPGHPCRFHLLVYPGLLTVINLLARHSRPRSSFPRGGGGIHSDRRRLRNQLPSLKGSPAPALGSILSPLAPLSSSSRHAWGIHFSLRYLHWYANPRNLRHSLSCPPQIPGTKKTGS